MKLYCSELDDSTFTVISDECLKDTILNSVTELQYSFMMVLHSVNLGCNICELLNVLKINVN